MIERDDGAILYSLGDVIQTTRKISSNVWASCNNSKIPTNLPSGPIIDPHNFRWVRDDPVISEYGLRQVATNGSIYAVAKTTNNSFVITFGNGIFLNNSQTKSITSSEQLSGVNSFHYSGNKWVAFVTYSPANPDARTIYIRCYYSTTQNIGGEWAFVNVTNYTYSNGSNSLTQTGATSNGVYWVSFANVGSDGNSSPSFKDAKVSTNLTNWTNVPLVSNYGLSELLYYNSTYYQLTYNASLYKYTLRTGSSHTSINSSVVLTLNGYKFSIHTHMFIFDDMLFLVDGANSKLYYKKGSAGFKNLTLSSNESTLWGYKMSGKARMISNSGNLYTVNSNGDLVFDISSRKSLSYAIHTTNIFSENVGVWLTGGAHDISYRTPNIEEVDGVKSFIKIR